MRFTPKDLTISFAYEFSLGSTNFWYIRGAYLAFGVNIGGVSLEGSEHFTADEEDTLRNLLQSVLDRVESRIGVDNGNPRVDRPVLGQPDHPKDA